VLIAQIEAGSIVPIGAAADKKRNSSDQPGRYSPVFGSGFNFGIAVRSCGSTEALARISSSSALTRCTSLTHQRASTTAPMTPSAKTTSGGIALLS